MRRNVYRRRLIWIGAVGLMVWGLSLIDALSGITIVAFGSAGDQIHHLRTDLLIRHLAWLAAGAGMWGAAWLLGRRRRRSAVGRSFSAGTESL